MSNKNKFLDIDTLKMGVSIGLMFLLLLVWELVVEELIVKFGFDSSVLGAYGSEPIGDHFIAGVFIILSLVVYSYLLKRDCSLCEKIRLHLGFPTSEENVKEQLKFILENADLNTQKEISELIRDRYNKVTYKHYFESSEDREPEKS
jgi:hypothetical protein